MVRTWTSGTLMPGRAVVKGVSLPLASMGRLLIDRRDHWEDHSTRPQENDSSRLHLVLSLMRLLKEVTTATVTRHRRRSSDLDHCRHPQGQQLLGLANITSRMSVRVIG